ncbi:hypothetical protein MNB_SV-9-1539 [hydrothermal vent metagenome]|uniref:General secretion pathway protein K n=1 Tax=hydrothermal vent metagenome TaxID=652676 RepID=A0A1W1BGC9_9ZZZZ
MRKGIVLFITLSIIIAMLGLVGIIFSYLDKAKKNSSHTSAMIQANLFFVDTSNAIKVLLKRVGNSKDKKKMIADTIYLAPVVLQPENGNAFVNAECKPLDGGVDINWLGYENNKSMQPQYTIAQSLFDKIVDEYSIEDATLLLDKILESIKQEDEIESNYRVLDRRGINSLKEFKDIIRDYQFEADDTKVGDILWEKFFSFDIGSDRVDGNYISAELVAMLFDMDYDVIKDEWFMGEDLNKFISAHDGDKENYNNKVFSKDIIERLNCKVTYSYQGNIYAFGFDYLDKGAKRFEFYGNQ